MSKLRGILGDFANWRPVVGRKVLQLTIEVPIEQTRDVLEKLGQPIPGQSLWVAVALVDPSKLNPDAAQESEANGSPTSRKWEDLPLSTQAAIRCGEPDFRRFLSDLPKGAMTISVESDEDVAPEWVRKLCDVDSRRQIIAGTTAGDAWLDLDARYQSWLTDRQYAGARTR